MQSSFSDLEYAAKKKQNTTGSLFVWNRRDNALALSTECHCPALSG